MTIAGKEKQRAPAGRIFLVENIVRGAAADRVARQAGRKWPEERDCAEQDAGWERATRQGEKGTANPGARLRATREGRRKVVQGREAARENHHARPPPRAQPAAWSFRRGGARGAGRIRQRAAQTPIAATMGGIHPRATRRDNFRVVRSSKRPHQDGFSVTKQNKTALRWGIWIEAEY